MKLFNIILSLLLSITVNAQTILFNKTYDYGFPDKGMDIIPTQDSNYLIAVQYNRLLKINSIGDTLWSKTFGNYTVRQFAEQNDGSIIVAGVVNDSISSSFLMKVTAFGDSIWLKKYTIRNGIFANIDVSPNGNIFAVGYTYTTPNPSDSTGANAWLLKTDSSGNIIYEKQLNVGQNHEIFFNLHVNVDESVYCVGYSLDTSNSSNGYLAYFDTNGDTLFTKTYTDITRINDITLTPDSNFVIVGSIKVSNKEYALASKITQYGQPLWEKSYARDTNNYNFKVVKPLFSNLFLVGGNDYDLTQNPVKKRTRFMVLDAIGDSLWSEQYTFSGGNSDNEMQSVITTPNNGFIFTGSSLIIPQQDLWVVRVDSVDCLNFVNGCQIIGLEETTKSQNEVLVYPNPTTGIIGIDLFGMELENITVEVVNSFGQLISQTTITNNKGLIDIHQQPNGLYLLRISNKEQIITKKVMKQ